MKLKHTRAFTLIELLVVIAIIGVLASIVLVSVNDARRKARDAKRVADLQAVVLALDQYIDANLVYPAALSGLVPQYLSATPKDPSTGVDYSYARCTPTGGAGPTRVHLGAVLEDTGSTALQNDSDYDSGAVGAGTLCGGAWTGGFSGADTARVYDIVR